MLAVSTEAGVGESAVITLIFPFGARSCSMGETGTALADDESALYYNPAGLGVQNSRWQGGSAGHSFESLLPLLGIPDLWHLSLYGYYQPPNPNIGGFGIFANFINMGENWISDALGRTIGIAQSWEGVVALGWGSNFRELGDTTHNFGITAKYYYSALAPGYGPHGEGTASGLCFDLGYLWLTPLGLRIGATLINMGRDVYYVDPDILDPLPLTVNLALGYKKQFITNGIRLLDIAGELRFDKELVVSHSNRKPDPFWKAMFTEWGDSSLSYELQEINIHAGLEIGIMNTAFFRSGLLFDYIGERYEYTQGFGINIFDHLRCDLSYIVAPEGFMGDFLKHFNKEKTGSTGVRDRQLRFSLTVTGLARWGEHNRKWWMVPQKAL